MNQSDPLRSGRGGRCCRPVSEARAPPMQHGTCKKGCEDIERGLETSRQMLECHLPAGSSLARWVVTGPLGAGSSLARWIVTCPLGRYLANKLALDMWCGAASHLQWGASALPLPCAVFTEQTRASRHGVSFVASWPRARNRAPRSPRDSVRLRPRARNPPARPPRDLVRGCAQATS